MDDGDQLKYRLQQLERAKNYKSEATMKKKTDALKKQYAIYKTIIQDLQVMLQKKNMYVHDFKRAHEVLQDDKVENVKIVFHGKTPENGSHRKVYDAPVVREVAAILPEEDTRTWNSRCVIVYLKDTNHRRSQMK